MAVKFMIFVSNLGELGGCCQGNLIPLYFWGQFLRKIGGFKILEIAESPERDRRAVSPACPAIACGDGGSNVEGAKGYPDSIGDLVRIHLEYKRILAFRFVGLITVIFKF